MQYCKNTEQDLCSWLFWGYYRGVGRMDSGWLWYWGRQWHQL